MNLMFAGMFVFTFSTIVFAVNWHDQSARAEAREECDDEEPGPDPTDHV